MLIGSKAMIYSVLNEVRKETKYPLLTIESNSPIPDNLIFDFIKNTDVTSYQEGHSNIDGLISLFAEKSGMVGIRKRAFDTSSVDINSVDFTRFDFHEIALFTRDYVSQALNGEGDKRFLFESLFSASTGGVDTNLNTRTGELSGDLYLGKYPSVEDFVDALTNLSKLDYLDVTFRYWDMPEGLNAREDQDSFVNLALFTLKNGEFKEGKPDSKVVRKFNSLDVYKDKKLRPENAVPMCLFNEYCDYIKSKVDEIDETPVSLFIEKLCKES